MTSPVKVLHVVKGLGPGGAERLLVALAKASDRQRVRHRVAYLLPEKSHLADDLRAAGVIVDCLGASAWVRALRRLIEEDRPHVVHAHSPLPAAAARLVARTQQRVHRPVTLSTEHNRWAAYHPLTRLANAVTYPLDARHLAVSEDARASVWAPLRGSTAVLHHGIDVAEVAAHRSRRAEMRAGLGLGDDDVAAVVVANYRREKDYPNLLAAARRVADTGMPVRFLVLGQGPLRDEIERRRDALGLGGHVALLGYRPDATAVMAGADMFVLGSRHEGLPVALLEAFALGLPVVATDVGGVREAVRHGQEGILVPPGQPTALAAAVVELATRPDVRASMSEAAARRAADFDVQRVARRLEDFYAEVRR